MTGIPNTLEKILFKSGQLGSFISLPALSGLAFGTIDTAASLVEGPQQPHKINVDILSLNFIPDSGAAGCHSREVKNSSSSYPNFQ